MTPSPTKAGQAQTPWEIDLDTKRITVIVRTEPEGEPDIVADFGMAAIPEYQRRAAFAVRAANSYQTMVAALELVARGLESGHVRAEPIITMDPDAEQVPVQTLDEIVGAALKLARGEA